MKKIMFLLFIFAFIFNVSAADHLNKSAVYVKENSPQVYDVIKDYSEGKWGTDYGMVVYEINQQCEGLLNVFILLHDSTDAEETVIVNAIDKWCDGDVMNYENPFLAPINWHMVVYTAREQIKAMGAY